MNSDGSAKTHAKSDVILTGTAKTFGLVEIGSNEKAYLFRVALPGVRHKCNIKFYIQRDGRVEIEGMITESTEALKDLPKGYEMKVHQLPSPGPFTITFNLPGPVDPRVCSPEFRADGIFEAIVMKHMHVATEGLRDNWYKAPSIKVEL